MASHPYDRYHNPCLFTAQDGEPLFILRAQDAMAPEIVRQWATAAVLARVNDGKVADARRVADAMLEWQSAHGSKTPD